MLAIPTRRATTAPTSGPRFFATGIAPLDALLGDGFAHHAVTEPSGASDDVSILSLDPFVPPLAALVLAWSLVPLAPFPDPADVFMQALFLATISSTTSFSVLPTLPHGLSTSVPIAPHAWPLSAVHQLLALISSSSTTTTTTAAVRAIRAVTATLLPPTVDDLVHWCTTISPSSPVLTPLIRVAASANDVVTACAARPSAAAWVAASLMPTVAVPEGPVHAAVNAACGGS
ncbi:hypothetical protein AMAG_18981 [Allomyces macrogynus ATCC 38327]|uniref:Uncharacterized protein n=1 Tax=Allomyces macrogynus (strain ATCC 38327) TaxID=578462 RepID=A0A0L0SL85_ALLM3|nr:hypothetical protein AMAG_18981 [Allomyces macrogynus ATCC 38327]|eukprot:KNE63277.1 hypothetical protein AMAG_18981 [Allomyces macrogynus ATCC 38327]